MRLTVSEFRAEETPVAAAAALCAAMTARDVQDWAAGAQPGAQRLYAVGGNASRDAGPGVAAAMRDLARLYLVTLIQRPRGVADELAGFPTDYLAQRTAKAWPVQGVRS